MATDRGPPPSLPAFPARYNAAADLLGRQLTPERSGKVAMVDDQRAVTFAGLAHAAGQAAVGLRHLGLQPGQRVLLCLEDSLEFPAAFLGAILLGAVPVPINTLFVAADCAYVADDSGAPLALVSPSLLAKWQAALAGARRRTQLVATGPESAWERILEAIEPIGDKSPLEFAARTGPEDVAFWLYSSGSTGRPKAAIHRQRHLAQTAELYGQRILGLRADDVIYSAAKLCFAYGLGNALSFPLYSGAQSVLRADRPTPSRVLRVLRERQVTIFCGIPTLFASILADQETKGSAAEPAAGLSLRCCISAGEPLPQTIGERWRDRFGVDILDGLGSTELLHIFLSNRPDRLRYGTTGWPVPGYELSLRDAGGGEVADGELGALWVNGPTACAGYWNQPEKTQETFLGPWTRTGDVYARNSDGSFTYGGRGDDMLKVSGNWVSPFEVEAALQRHPAVLEAAVVGAKDEAGLIKPRAVVVLKDAAQGSAPLAEELKAFVKEVLAPYKYPRWIDFAAALPKTATGKIQRFKLR